jgi:cytochrome c5
MKLFIRFTAMLSLCCAASVAMADAKAIETLYNQSCVACHLTGAAGAPKTGDAAAWKPRLDKGMDVMLANVKNGINAMPPKGMCMNCSDEDFKGLIEYMAKPAK